MNRMMNANTGREMVNSGSWVKVARKHYRHVSGVEIVFNCNRRIWQIVGDDAYSLLWVARHRAERWALETAQTVGVH